MAAQLVHVMTIRKVKDDVAEVIDTKTNVLLGRCIVRDSKKWRFQANSELLSETDLEEIARWLRMENEV